MAVQVGELRGFSLGGKTWPLKHVLLGAALLLAAVASPFKLGVVSGSSMSPSMAHGALYFMDRTYFRTKPLERDTVVVFNHNGGPYIKRIVGVPGDTIFLVRYQQHAQQDELLMDWQLARLRRAIARPPWNQSMKLVEQRLAPGEYYVVGDNLTDSEDSRVFGPISKDAIQGRVLFAPPGQPELDRMARQFGRPSKS